MGQEEPLQPACEEHPGMTGELILGWCRDQIHGFDISSGSDMNEPKVRARTITVSLAVSSDLSSQEHTSTPSPDMIMYSRLALGDYSAAGKQESRKKTREPAMPLPCPEARTVTPSSAPPAVTPAMPAARELPMMRVTTTTRAGPGLTCDTCGRRDSSHTRDTSVPVTPEMPATPSAPATAAIPEVPASPVTPAEPVTPATPGIPASPMTP